MFIYGAKCSSKANGNWTSAGTWNCSSPLTTPGCPDTIIINHTVTVNDQVDLIACGSLYVIVNATLKFNTGKKLYLADGSHVVLNTGATLDPGNGGGNSNLIEIGGNEVWTAADGPKSGPLTFYSGGALPVKLLDFSAINNESKVDLKWVTLTEQNNHYFTIEKSKDAKNWNEVVKTYGIGNSNTAIEYFETDYNPYDGVSYYRLKQTDYDGNFEYFKIVSVNVKPKELGFNTFPNPLLAGNDLKIEFNSKEEEILIVIRDVKGQEFYSKAIVFIEDNNVTAIPLSSDVPPGMYIVTATSKNEIYSRKILIR